MTQLTNSNSNTNEVSLGDILAAIKSRQNVLMCLINGDSIDLSAGDRNAGDDNAVVDNAGVRTFEDKDADSNSIAAIDTIKVNSIASLDDARSNQLSFLSNPKYIDSLKSTNAELVIVNETHKSDVPRSSCAVVVDNPYLAYASVTRLFESKTCTTAIVHPTASIAQSATIAEDVTVGAYAVIEEGVKIGKGSIIGTHVHIGRAVSIGEYGKIMSHVNIAHHCELGDHVRVHANATIGSEGFGFAPTADPATQGWERIAQLGRVVIGNHVRIGSQTCVDRGAIDDTVIEDHVIIDNLVQIAHNVRIGAGTAIAAMTGIAGSATIGKRCLIGGNCGIVGHITIADDVTLTGRTYVAKSITESGSYSSGTLAMPTSKWRRAVINFKQLGKK